MPQRKCWIDGCFDESVMWGMCIMHSYQWNRLIRNRAMTKLHNKTDLERYEYYLIRGASLEIQEHFGAWPDCHIWRGTMNHHGYGLMRSAFSERGNGQQIHLFVLSEVVGMDLIKGQETDHLCRFRPCSNPKHLERVGGAENKLRGIGFAGENSRKSHCDKGHEFSRENTRMDKYGWRNCKTCERATGAEYRSRPEVIEAQRKAREAIIPPTGVRGKGQWMAERDACPKGHKFEGDNLSMETLVKKGVTYEARRCVTCKNELARINHAKRVAARRAPDAIDYNTNEYIDGDGIAVLLDIKRSYVSTYLRRQEGFPAGTKSGRSLYYKRQEVLDWINTRP